MTEEFEERDLEKEREELLGEINKNISEELKETIEFVANISETQKEFNINISNSGAEYAND